MYVYLRTYKSVCIRIYARHLVRTLTPSGQSMLTYLPTYLPTYLTLTLTPTASSLQLFLASLHWPSQALPHFLLLCPILLFLWSTLELAYWKLLAKPR